METTTKKGRQWPDGLDDEDNHWQSHIFHRTLGGNRANKLFGTSFGTEQRRNISATPKFAPIHQGSHIVSFSARACKRYPNQLQSMQMVCAFVELSVNQVCSTRSDTKKQKLCLCLGIWRQNDKTTVQSLGWCAPFLCDGWKEWSETTKKVFI